VQSRRIRDETTRVPHPCLSRFWKDRVGKLVGKFTHHNVPRTSVVTSPHALGTQTISADAQPAFHHLQLLPSRSSSGYAGGPPRLRANFRESAAVVRAIRDRIRRHARTRSSTDQRAGRRNLGNRDSDAQTDCCPSIEGDCRCSSRKPAQDDRVGVELRCFLMSFCCLSNSIAS